MYRAKAEWGLDSGGFSELSIFGKWHTTARQYVDEVLRWSEKIGRLSFAAIQDWMCEPIMLQKTGLSIREHQHRTVASYLQLRDMAPSIPWLPVLQGWEEEDYLRHFEDYNQAGVDLLSFDYVGLGSVCRRQHTDMAEQLIARLSGMGLKIHAFGFKQLGLRRVWRHLRSSDSMSWSFEARQAGKPFDPSCTHKNCANCFLYAFIWRNHLMMELAR